jgi:precorrin-6A/cobalt-precorrin-6A reductase
LGGSADASALARLLAGDARFAPVLSFAGRTAHPALPPIPYRIGGFGGAAGLADWLRAEGCALVVDATHPFARRISANARQAAAMAGVKLLAIGRPRWQPGPGDDWRMVETLDQAAIALGSTPRRVFLAVGRNELTPFHATPHFYLVRSVDPVPEDALPPGAQTITARGPFALADEIALLAAHRIEQVLCKNAGGEATRAKLDAARALGLTVVMQDRPEPPPDALPDAASLHARLVAHVSAPRGV